MEINSQNKLFFHGVKIINVNFNSIAAISKEKPEIDIKIEPRVFIPKDNETDFHILMNVKVQADEYFELNLVAVGSFSVSGEFVNTEIRKNFINANAPAIMFPYVRAFVSTFTSNLGDVTGRILIPTQFFKGELNQLEDSLSMNSLIDGQ